jgi:1,4-dihydroxy-2-naphthoate octaprenyltransferase
LAVILGEHKARIVLAMFITAALIIHAIFAIQVSFILWLTTILLVAPSYYVIKKGFTLQGSALTALLANVAQVGFLYCFSVALSLIIFL